MYSGGRRIGYYVNGTRFTETADGTPLTPDDEIIYDRLRSTGGTFETLSNAIYVQDSWAISSRLTFNFGVRWEQYDNKNANGETFIKIDDQYAPRLGLIWDPSGQGRSKLFASFGQYHLPIASNTNIRLAGLEYDAVDWYVLPPARGPDELGYPTAYRRATSARPSTRMATVPDPDGVRVHQPRPDVAERVHHRRRADDGRQLVARRPLRAGASSTRSSRT